MLKVLVVATWGFPGSWRRVDYAAPVPPKDVNKWGKLAEWGMAKEKEYYSSHDVYHSSHSASFALACSLVKQGFSVRVLVFGVDTLAATPKPSCAPNDKLCEDLRKKLVELGCLAPEGLSYDAVRGRALEVLKLYAEGFKRELGECMNNVEVDYAIVPGTGVYRCELGGQTNIAYKLTGSPLNAYATIRLKTLEKLVSQHSRNEPVDAVVLDTSHGVNYLPVLAREAVVEAVKLCSTLYNRNTGFALVNSDPVQAANPDKLWIHLVEAWSFKPSLAQLLASRQPSEPYLRTLYKTSPHGKARELNDTADEVWKKYKGLLEGLKLAVSHGLALYVATKLLDLDHNKLEEDIKNLSKLLDEALSEREVKLGRDTILVEHSYAAMPSLLDLVDMLRLASNLSTKLHSTKDEMSHKVGGNVLVKASWLEKFTEEDLGAPETALTVLKNELYDIERRVKNIEQMLRSLGYDVSKPIPYKIVYEATSTIIAEHRQAREPEQSEETCSPGSVGERNFLAHAGLERNTFLVYMNKDELYIGYKRECLETIENLVNNLARTSKRG